jgi:hypothetical protein
MLKRWFNKFTKIIWDEPKSTILSFTKGPIPHIDKPIK